MRAPGAASSRRSEARQPRVAALAEREVVQRQPGGDGGLDRILTGEGGHEAFLGAAHRAEPHRGEEIVEGGEAVVDGALRRPAGGDDAVNGRGTRSCLQLRSSSDRELPPRSDSSSSSATATAPP
jgi:hypothetical protein